MALENIVAPESDIAEIEFSRGDIGILEDININSNLSTELILISTNNEIEDYAFIG